MLLDICVGPMCSIMWVLALEGHGPGERCIIGSFGNQLLDLSRMTAVGDVFHGWCLD